MPCHWNSELASGYIKKAVGLNETGARLPPRPKPKGRKELIVPAELVTALKTNKKALTAFENFSYSHKKEYVQWITEAKREETRTRRLATAIECCLQFSAASSDRQIE